MLSRIADALYWMSRLVERAESTARLVEINLIHLVEAERALSEAAEWSPLLSIVGQEQLYAAVTGGAPVTAAGVTHFLVAEGRNPSSIRSCLRGARENARVVRDRISKEMWEELNGLWLEAEERLEGPGPVGAGFCRWLRGAVHRFHGTTASTMMRGEAFGFYLLGSFLERADMTCRILDVKYHLLLPDLSLVGSVLDYYQWAALLRSLSGFEPYRRRYPALRPFDVAHFVVFDPDFPRSVRFAVDRMEQALTKIAPARPDSPALRRLAELRALLEDSDRERLVRQGLHEWLTTFLAGLARLHEAVQGEFFAVHLDPAPCAT